MSDTVGECVVTWFEDPVTLRRRIRIDRADPIIWIADEFLDPVKPYGVMKWQHPDGFMEIECLPDREVEVVRIFGENRDVTYVVGDHDRERNAWSAHWPD